MWFIWFMWAFAVIVSIITIVLLTGKGSMLVSGFNTKSPEEREKYDKKKVSRQAGVFMLLIDIGLILLSSYIHLRVLPVIQNHTISDQSREIMAVSFGFCGYVIAVAAVAVIRGFKHCLKEDKNS